MFFDVGPGMTGGTAERNLRDEERGERGDEEVVEVIETLAAALAPERRSRFLESAAVRAVMEHRDS